ncbi:MAG TPA: hypothetical protein VEU30_13080 [Thermoanaerobaculia bacterium]|nr:hypothetical protein [Thermoanaerobaculia bacterium]
MASREGRHTDISLRATAKSARPVSLTGMFKIRVAAALFAVCLVPHASAQGSLSRLVKVLSEIYEHYNDISDTSDDVMFAIGAAGDAYLGNPVTPPAWSTGEFVKVIRLRTKAIEELELPEFEMPLPSTGNVPTNSFDATRGELRRRNQALHAAAIELAEANAVRHSLDGAVKGVDHARKAAVTLGKLLQELQPFDFTGAIGFTGFELQTLVDPALGDQGAAVKTKRDEWIVKAKARANALENARIDLRNRLVIEANALDAQARVLRAEQDALATRKKAIDQEKRLLDELKIKIGDLQTSYDALVTQRDRERSRLSGRRSVLGSLRSEEQRLNTEIGRPYDRCPNGATFEVCDHWLSRQKWLEEKAALRKQLANVRASIQNTNQEIVAIEDAIRNLTSRISTQRVRLDEATSEHAARTTKLSAVRAKWQSDRDDFWTRAWKSRALAFADENASDQQQLATIETRIREVQQ